MLDMLDTHMAHILLVSVKPKVKQTQLSTSPEELQSHLLDIWLLTLTELSSQLIPQPLLL